MTNKNIIMRRFLQPQPIAGLALAVTFSAGFSADPATAAEGQGFSLEEIVVTAQRRQESLMEVPISMTAFTEVTLEKNMIDEVEDYFIKTPNIHISDGATRSGNVSSSSHGLAIRGISNVGGNTSSFGFYVDDFNITKATLNPHLVDVERIEVMRGPQGTFFGRNASGGVINVTTNKPNDRLEGKFSTEFSRFDSWETQGTLNIPVSDKLMLRGSLKYADSDGYAENKFISGSNGYEHKFARLSARFLPADNITIDLNAMYTDEEQDDLGLIHTGVYRSGIAAFLCDNLLGAGAVSACPFDTGKGLYPHNRDSYYHNNPLRVEDEYKMYNTQLVWEGEKVTFTGILGYIETDFFRGGELDFASVDVLNEDFQYREEESTSVEFRLQSNGDGPFNWIIGGIWAEDKESGIENINFGSEPITLATFGVFNHFRIEESTSDNTITSTALFAEGRWDATERLTLTLGVRWSEDEVDVKGTIIEFESPVTAQQDDETFDDISPRFALNYALSEEVNLYATVANGWKAGGVNLFPVERFDEETLWNYEVGLKSELWDKRVRLNLAAFYIKWEDIQVQTSRLIVRGDGTLASDSGINNGARATSQGLEFELTALLTPQLEVGLNIGYNDTEFDSYKNAVTSFNDADNPVDLSGQPLPKAPEWSVSADAQYNFQLTDEWGAFVRAEFSYEDENIFDINGLHAVLLGDKFPYVIPSRDIWNFRVGVHNDRFRLVGYVENAFDEEYHTSNFDFAFLNGTGVVPSYRNYGIKLTAYFD